MSMRESLARDIARRILSALPVGDDHETPRIEVDIEGSHATLKGDVHTWADHETAERIAASTPGITSVDNQLCLFVKAKLSTI